MGTLSSLTGGGSSGGGGDPSGKFQASATVANGDLVVLNDNGTVAPVTSVLQATQFTRSDNGTNVDGATSNPASTYGSAIVHNGTRDEYIMIVRNSSSYLTFDAFTYNDSTGQFTAITNGLSNMYSGAWCVHADQTNNVFIIGFLDTSNRPRVRGIYHNGSNWVLSNDSVYLQTAGASDCIYTGRSADGVIVAASRETGGHVGTTTLSWDNSGTPQQTSAYMNNASQRLSGSSSGLLGNADLGGFYGAFCGGQVHVVHVRDTGDSFKGKLLAFNAAVGGTTFGTYTATGITTANNYGHIVYDPIGNVGLTFHDDGTGTNNAPCVAFTVNADLSITIHGEVTKCYAYGSLGFNPVTNLFTVQTDGRVFKSFALNSSGVKTSETTNTLLPSTSGSLNCEYGDIRPRTNSPFDIYSFRGDRNFGSYVVNTNQSYGTQAHPAYLQTNIDNHFGEAKEAIASGAAGSVGILNRSVDITGASFQKGQKLFANPSGTALATSGTYRVGHATDGDSVLVLGDPS